jgi:hypothetical protein
MYLSNIHIKTYFTVEKSSAKIWRTFHNYRKTAQTKDHPIGETSANLVTMVEEADSSDENSSRGVVGEKNSRMLPLLRLPTSHGHLFFLPKSFPDLTAHEFSRLQKLVRRGV